MIKPDAVQNGHVGAILEKITTAGFVIRGLKMSQLSQREAEAFYEVHKQRPFFGELVAFMTSGPIVVAVLEKENAVADFRALSGQQTPRKRQKEQSENYLRSQWEETRFTDLIVMTTQRLSSHSTFPQGRSTK